MDIGLSNFVPSLFGGLTALLGVATLVAKANLVKNVGEVADKVLHGIAANPGVIMGIMICTSATGAISVIAYRQFPCPIRPILLENASEKDKEHYLQDLKDYESSRRLHALMTTGFIVIVGVVCAGGIFLAYKLDDGKLKLVELEALNKKTLLELQFANSCATEQLRNIFDQVSKCGSPSFAMVFNDTAETCYLKACHIAGPLGGDFTSRPYCVHPGEYKIVAGNVNSWGTHSGMSVLKEGSSHGYQKVLHGQVVPTSLLK